MGGIQYCGGMPSVLWGITAVHVGDSFNTVGIPSVLWRLFSTVADNISTVGIASVLWRAFSTVGSALVLWGYNNSTVEVIQYSGDKDLKYYEFSKNLEIFSRAYFALQSDRPHRRPQVLTTGSMVKDIKT